MARILKKDPIVMIDGVDYSNEISSAKVSIQDADGGTTTFADAYTGGAKEYMFSGTVIQDLTSDLFTMLTGSVGDTVAVVLKPYHNTTATALQPHITFTATVKMPDGDWVLGEADAASAADYTTEFEWSIVGTPVVDTGA